MLWTLLLVVAAVPLTYMGVRLMTSTEHAGELHGRALPRVSVIRGIPQWGDTGPNVQVFRPTEYLWALQTLSHIRLQVRRDWFNYQADIFLRSQLGALPCRLRCTTTDTSVSTHHARNSIVP